MKKNALFVICLLALNLFAADPLPRDYSGIEPAAVAAFIDSLAEDGLDTHSFMLLQHGKVIAEGCWQPYTMEDFSGLASLSKGYIGTAVGFAIQDGLLTLDDKVINYFPESQPAAPSEWWQEMTIHDLLSFQTGHTLDTARFMWADPARKPEEIFFERPLEHEPGTFFLYNNGIPHMLTLIVEKVSGKRFVNYLAEKLFDPLGIACRTNPDGTWKGALQVEGIARFGQFLLQEGMWEGKQLLNKEWIKLATSRQSSGMGHMAQPDWEQGFGYMFWLCRHGFFRGDGSHSQFMLVMPELDAVLVITSGHQEYQTTLDIAYKTLIAALRGEFIAEKQVSQAELADKLAGLSMALPGAVSEHIALDGRYLVQAAAAEGDRLEFKMAANKTGIVLDFETAEASFNYHGWRNNNISVYDSPLHAGEFRGRAVWTGDDELELLAYYCYHQNYIKLKLEGYDGKIKVTMADGVEYKGTMARIVEE